MLKLEIENVTKKMEPRKSETTNHQTDKEKNDKYGEDRMEE